MQFETKAITLKAIDDAGRGLAVIATLSAVDADDDTYDRGAFGEQPVMVLAAHDHATVPLGKGRVFERGDQALAEFRLNLDSKTAAEWHSALKFDLADGHPVQEWSYGFRVIDARHEQRDGRRVRVLTRLKVHEISPVVVAAGVGTRTVTVKHAPAPDPEAAVRRGLAALSRAAAVVHRGAGTADPEAEAGRLLAAFAALRHGG